MIPARVCRRQPCCRRGSDHIVKGARVSPSGKNQHVPTCWEWARYRLRSGGSTIYSVVLFRPEAGFASWRCWWHFGRLVKGDGLAAHGVHLAKDAVPVGAPDVLCGSPCQASRAVSGPRH